MRSALDALAMMVLLSVVVWVVGFGLVGAEVGRAAGHRRPVGFAIGALGGPFGLAYLWWRARSSPGLAWTGDDGTRDHVDLEDDQPPFRL